MDPEAAFLEAALPEPVTLLRQQLQPYSLGHEMLLQRIGNAFLTRQAMPTVDDLYWGVYICCHTYDEAVAALRQTEEEFKALMAAWQKKVGAISEVELLELMIEFQRYINDGSQCPKFREISRPGQGARRRPGAPAAVALLNCLTGDLHWSRHEALNAPLGLARWHYCAWWERRGNIAITAKDEAAEIQRVREEAAKLGWRPMKFARGALVVTAEEDAKLRKAEQAAASEISNLKSEIGGPAHGS